MAVEAVMEVEFRSMNDTRDEVVRELLQTIARLKALHRHGLTPAFGEIETMFDLAASLGPVFELGTSGASSSWPVAKRRSRIEAAAIAFVESGVLPVRGVEPATAALLAELSAAVDNETLGAAVPGRPPMPTVPPNRVLRDGDVPRRTSERCG